jgi:hypothetical protein
MFIALAENERSSSVGAKCGRCRSGAWESYRRCGYKHAAPLALNPLKSLVGNYAPASVRQIICLSRQSAAMIVSITTSEVKYDSRS